MPPDNVRSIPRGLGRMESVSGFVSENPVYACGANLKGRPLGMMSRAEAREALGRGEVRKVNHGTAIQWALPASDIHKRRTLSDESSTMRPVVAEKAASGSHYFGALVCEWSPAASSHDAAYRAAQSRIAKELEVRTHRKVA